MGLMPALPQRQAGKMSLRNDLHDQASTETLEELSHKVYLCSVSFRELAERKWLPVPPESPT